MSDVSRTPAAAGPGSSAVALLRRLTAHAQFDAATVLGNVTRRTGRRRARRHRDPDQPRDRDRRDHRQRVHRGLSVPQRPRRHLSDRGRDPRVLEGGRAVRDRHRQRPAARRPHHEGRRHRRDGGGDRRAHARKRVERPRPGHRPRADRQPAAERPRLRRSGAAQPRRPPVVDQQLARRLVQRQRDAQLAQQLHPRRRRQQLLRHQQPGLLEPGRPGLAGRRRGVQGPDQQLQRRVRTRRRRGHQRHVPQRHERFPRHRVGVQPQYLAQRHRLLQAVVGRQAQVEPQPVPAASSAARSCATARSSSSTTKASGRPPAPSPSPASRRWPNARARWAARSSTR